MVKFDDQAGVYEAYSDSNGTEWLGAFDTFAEASIAVKIDAAYALLNALQEA